MNKKNESVLENAKEVILKEKKALEDLADLLDSSFEKTVELILNRKGKLVISGVGKAGLVGKKIAATFSSLGTPSFFMHPTEGAHGDLGAVEKQDVLILISNSGSSDEILEIIPVLKAIGSPIIAVTGKKDSKLAKESDVTLFIGELEEACGMNLAPTTSTTAILALGDALAVCVMKARKTFSEENFGFYHPAGKLGKRLMKVKHIMNAKPVALSPKTPVKEILIAITQNKSGVAVIVEEGFVKAVFTDGDLRRLINQKGSLDQAVVEVATKNPTILSWESPVSEALELMKVKAIKDLPLVDEEGKLKGIISIKDLFDRNII